MLLEERLDFFKSTNNLQSTKQHSSHRNLDYDQIKFINMEPRDISILDNNEKSLNHNFR